MNGGKPPIDMNVKNSNMKAANAHLACIISIKATEKMRLLVGEINHKGMKGQGKNPTKEK